MNVNERKDMTGRQKQKKKKKNCATEKTVKQKKKTFGTRAA